MNDAGGAACAAQRLLVRWDGPVQWRARGGLVSLRGAGRELIFAGATAEGRAGPAGPAGADLLPERLHDVSVTQLDDATAPGASASPQARRCLYRIDSREARVLLRARSVQHHSSVEEAFHAVLPPVRVAMLSRFGWALLLTVLRVPAAARLLRRSGA